MGGSESKETKAQGDRCLQCDVNSISQLCAPHEYCLKCAGFQYFRCKLCQKVVQGWRRFNAHEHDCEYRQEEARIRREKNEMQWEGGDIETEIQRNEIQRKQHEEAIRQRAETQRIKEMQRKQNAEAIRQRVERQRRNEIQRKLNEEAMQRQRAEIQRKQNEEAVQRQLEMQRRNEMQRKQYSEHEVSYLCKVFCCGNISDCNCIFWRLCLVY
eukprot:TRINITY_DN123_c0_g1_i9.p1 TRINITY_DN123_c0_g1~~TRINITY_DN123_c0_g1_i9.p1  ORF type:complete len:213 (-),score=12.98 TRINITY_DN123_c0_g1_i9:55-693(-)